MPEFMLYGGPFTFSNYGPLTTTFTPPPSCTATDRLQLGRVTSEFPQFLLSVKCSSQSEWDCVPTGTASSAATYDDLKYVGSAGYYSPGLYCPSGWSTMGSATADEHGSVSTSGYLVNTEEIEPYYPQPGTMLASMLKPSETMALCCPTGMTPNGLGSCFSTVADYKPSVGCSTDEDLTYDWQEITRTVPYSGSTATHTFQHASISTVSVETTTITLSNGGERFLTGIDVVPVITIVHHRSDLPESTGKAGSTEAGSAATGSSAGGSSATAASTSNAAVRLVSRSSWEGLGAVVGISTAAMALGAAMILPW